MEWQSRQTKLTIADQDTARVEQVINTGVGDHIVYGNLGPVIEFDEVVGHDSVPRYYRRKSDGVWLLWEGMSEVPDSAHILPALPAPGKSWQFSGHAQSAIACTVVTRGTRTVPAGTFRNCLEVRFLFPDRTGTSETRWYAPGIGVIYDEYVRDQSKDGHGIREQSVTELLSFRPSR
jgi:hypothetical protein